MLEIERAHDSERTQRRIVKAPASFEIAYSYRNIIQQRRSPVENRFISFLRAPLWRLYTANSW
jgi:hypothetical protein